MNVNSKASVEIELQRKRVATAKALLKEAREQANWAKCRRKLAKLLAKRALKGAKQAKTNLADAQTVLARAEAILHCGDNRRATTRNAGKPRAVARSASKSAQQLAVTPRKRRKLAGGTTAGPAAPPSESAPHEEISVSLGAITLEPPSPPLEDATGVDSNTIAEANPQRDL